MQRVEPRLTVNDPDGIHDVRPAQCVDRHPAREDDAEGQYDKLHVIGDHDRDHAAQDRVEKHDGEHHRHHQRNVDRIGEARKARDEDRPGLQEKPHVEDAREGQDNATRDADTAAEPPLVELGNGHHTHFPERHHDEARQPDDQR